VGNDVRIHDVATGTLVTTLRGHTATVESLAYGAGGTLATGSQDHTIRLWQTSGTAVAVQPASAVPGAPQQASAAP
jgi:WD40 repeat protein